MAKPTISPDSTLGHFFTGAGLTLVDIGARGDVRPEFRAIAPFSELVVCEPEAEEARQLEDRILQAVSWTGVTVMREALWTTEGSVVLYVTESPGLSSLRRPDPAVTSRYANADAFQVISEIAVPAITLDRAAQRYAFETACFLKLDTQGTELEIMQSGERLLASVLGVYIETLFRPFYEGQAVFGDVDNYLRGRGFELFDLHRSHVRAAGYSSDLYSRRQLTWAHCLYLRDPDHVLAHGGDWPTRYLAIAVAYEHFDHALTSRARQGWERRSSTLSASTPATRLTGSSSVGPRTPPRSSPRQPRIRGIRSGAARRHSEQTPNRCRHPTREPALEPEEAIQRPPHNVTRQHGPDVGPGGGQDLARTQRSRPRPREPERQRPGMDQRPWQPRRERHAVREARSTLAPGCRSARRAPPPERARLLLELAQDRELRERQPIGSQDTVEDAGALKRRDAREPVDGAARASPTRASG